MNAQELEFVTCPACHGAKKVLSMQGDKEVPCIHCQAYGDVDASRVCPDCGHWRHKGPCTGASAAPTAPDDGQTASAETAPPAAASSPANGKPLAEVKDKLPTGVTWDGAKEFYQATIYREGKLHYLGTFKDRDLAVGIREEAGRMPVSEYPALKASYAKLRKERRAPKRAHAPAIDEAPGRADDAPGATSVPGEATAERQSRTELVDAALTSLLTAAQRADFEALTLRQQMQRATDAYHEAEQRAIDAWNAYAAAIRKAVGDSLVVSQSRLGALFDDNGTGLAEET